MPSRIFVIGIDASGRFGIAKDEVAAMLADSSAVVGSKRQIALLEASVSSAIPQRLTWTLGMDQLIKEMSKEQGNLLVLASGDPGYFGIVRLLKRTFPNSQLLIHPVISSVSLAFARAGTNWEDAVVISAHGRSYQSVLTELVRAIQSRNSIDKLAVLCSSEHTPQFMAQLLLDAKAPFDRYLVCTDLGANTESVTEASLEELSMQLFDPNSILVGIRNTIRKAPSISNLSRSESGSEFLHRGNMITKPEVREVILSKMLPYISGESSCMWDLGAGSGSVGISAAQRVPSLRIFLVDQDPIQVRLAQLNSEKLSTAMVIAGHSEDVMWQLPDPNAVFVGGGGLEVLNTLKKRLAAPTFVLASFAAIDRAVTAANLLGSLMQVMLPVGKLLPNGSWRLEAENPVFLTWGWLG